MDTDGNIKDSANYKGANKSARFQMSFATTSIQLRDDVMELVYSLGYSCSTQVAIRAGGKCPDPEPEKNRNYVYKHDLYQITINVPNEEKPKFFKLSRKLTIAEEAAKHPKKRSYDRIAIKDIRKTGRKVPMRCIAINSPDHVFLVNDFIPTHNTFLSKAVAFEAGLNFVALNLNKIMDKYQGASERNLDRALECAMAMAPTIIFIDEIDEALPNRNDPNISSVNKRINQRLLTFFSDTSHRGEVMILAATNYPEKIDPAFKRAGRFDIRLPMFAPDGFDRMRITQIIAKSRKDKDGKGYTFSWFESPDDVIRNPFRNLGNWLREGGYLVNEKFVGQMVTYNFKTVDSLGKEKDTSKEIPATIRGVIDRDEITLEQFYKTTRILYEGLDPRRTDPSTGEVEAEADFFQRIHDFVEEHIYYIGDDPKDLEDVVSRLKKWEKVYKPFQDKTMQMTGAEIDVVINKCVTMWKKWSRRNPDKVKMLIKYGPERGGIADDHDIPFHPFLYDACRKTVSAVSGIKAMEDTALLNTSDIDYIPDAMYAITNEGREISYLERQDELKTSRMSIAGE